MTIVSAKTIVRQWMMISQTRCARSGSRTTSDSMPMCPASRTPAAAPSIVTQMTSSKAVLSAQTGVSFST